MAIIDSDGLFSGDRLRHCSYDAQLHWPRLFLASDGFARLEINYARIIGRAYPTFNPVPSEKEVQAWLREYAENYLLFPYDAGGQLWGQWDTRGELLPRYKTAADRRSPIPPEPAFTEWKRRYRQDNKSFPKCFGSISGYFLYGVGEGGGIGDGKNTRASEDARVTVAPRLIDNQPLETAEPDALFSVERKGPGKSADGLTPQQESWFTTWWAGYWLHKARKAARKAFAKQVTTTGRFDQVIAATQAQTAEMLTREPQHRPHGSTWLNQERWEDETAPEAKPKRDAGADAITKLIYGEGQ